MALYRLEAKIFSREKRGRSVVAASAYRSGSRLRDERYEKVHDYSRRSKGVIESVILRPENAPDWTGKPDTLWNTVERSEKRVDAQLAREFVLAVPPELNDKQQFELATSWAQKELVSRGMVAEASLHHTRTGNNPHVHILTTLRTLDGDKFSARKPREWNDVGTLMKWRESWADAVNGALEQAGREERVDHRSLKDRGIDRIPEPKIGVAATAMKRREVVEDPERFQLVRWVKSLNFVRPWAKSIEQSGEVHQEGVGKTWWERSLIYLSEAKQAVRETVMDYWDRLVHSHQHREHDMPSHGIPPRDIGPEPER
jgi:ATP-dependent exoDNAse (exonuclease V) alpha subunit